MTRLVGGYFDSFQASGVRESLADFISNISPEETPFYSSLGAAPNPQNRVHTWQTDTLAAASANSATEAEAWAPTAITPTDIMTNRVQHFLKEFAITDTQDVVNTAGRAKESAYQLVKAGKELKRDFEWSQFDYRSAASGYVGTTSAATLMTNMHYFVGNVNGHSGYSGKFHQNVTLCATADTTITENCFNLILQDIWDDGGRPNAVYVNGALKRLLSGWGTSTSRVWDGSKKITNAVDVYESDFGVLQLKLDRYAFSSMGYILDESLWKKAELHPVRRVDIGRTGLAQPFMLHAAWTLEARNPTGNGMFLSNP
jgi:hypothetical protein